MGKGKAGGGGGGAREKLVGEGGGGEGKAGKWKNQSEQFRAAIRNARKMKEAEAAGIDIRTLQMEEVPVEDDRVPCPYCNRKFAAMTAERHIPKCKETQARPRAVGAVKAAPKRR